MTVEELKIKIAESENYNWYKDFEFSIEYPQINFNLSFKGVVSIYEFILKQINGFKTLQNIPQEIEAVKIDFTIARDALLNLINNNSINDNQWRTDLNRIKKNSPTKFLYGFPETNFLIKIFQEKPNYYAGAYQYLSGNIQNLNDKNYFVGSLMAYEFSSTDTSVLVKRKESERKSISQIAIDFQTKLDSSEAQMTNYLAEAHKTFEDYTKKN